VDIVCANFIDAGKLSYEAVLVSHKAPLESHKRTFVEFLVEVAFLDTNEQVLHIYGALFSEVIRTS
jgi:hypothetical protein